MAGTARSHTRLRRRDPGAFAQRPRGEALASLVSSGTGEFNRWLHTAEADHRRLPRTVRLRCDALLSAPAAVVMPEPPTTQPDAPDPKPEVDPVVLADLLCRAVDRFPSARRVPEAQPPPRRHVQVVRLPGGAATTIVDGKFTSVECPGCGDLATIVGAGVCLACRRTGRRYEVVA